MASSKITVTGSTCQTDKVMKSRGSGETATGQRQGVLEQRRDLGGKSRGIQVKVVVLLVAKHHSPDKCVTVT